jgi:magnesium-transporting ATPase (P-type)
MAGTAAFATLGLVQFVQAYNMRSATVSVFADRKSNPTLLKGVLVAAVLHIATFTVPPLEKVFGTVSLKPSDWVIVLLSSFGMLVVGEMIKLVRRRQEAQVSRR